MNLSLDQRRLLGGWRDILDDVRRLGEGIESLPNDGDGRKHLPQLRQAVDALAVDAARFFPAIHVLLTAYAPDAIRTDGATLQREIAMAVRTYDRLVAGEYGLDGGVAASPVDALKQHASELLTHVRGLDRQLQG